MIVRLLWSPALKGFPLGSLSVCFLVLCFVTFDPHQNLRVRLLPLNMFKPSSDFFLTASRCCFFFGSFLLFIFHVYICKMSFLFLAAWCSPVGKGLTSSLSCSVCIIVFLSLSHMVLWVRHCTWLYRSLTLAFLSTCPCKSWTLFWIARKFDPQSCL